MRAACHPALRPCFSSWWVLAVKRLDCRRGRAGAGARLPAPTHLPQFFGCTDRQGMTSPPCQPLAAISLFTCCPVPTSPYRSRANLCTPAQRGSASQHQQLQRRPRLVCADASAVALCCLGHGRGSTSMVCCCLTLHPLASALQHSAARLATPGCLSDRAGWNCRTIGRGSRRRPTAAPFGRRCACCMHR